MQDQQRQAPPTTNATDVQVKKDYIRKNNAGDTQTQKCPLCNQQIPVSEFNEHFRIENLDPRYKEVKADVQARASNVTMVSGEDIAKNLQAFARNKPTVFGSEDQNKGQAQPKLIWDGQSGTMTRTTGNQAMIAQQQRRNFDEQKRAIQELDLGAQKQTIQSKPTMQQVVGPTAKIIQPAGPHLPTTHEKPNLSAEVTKRVRTEESHLIPEGTWLLMNPVNKLNYLILTNFL